MAGAIIIGFLNAQATVVSRLSQIPFAILPIVFAVQGAITNMSDGYLTYYIKKQFTNKFKYLQKLESIAFLLPFSIKEKTKSEIYSTLKNPN